MCSHILLVFAHLSIQHQSIYRPVIYHSIRVMKDEHGTIQMKDVEGKKKTIFPTLRTREAEVFHELNYAVVQLQPLLWY